MGHSPDRAARRDDHSLAISPESIYRFIHSPKGRKEKLNNYLAQAKSRRGRRARLGQSKPMIPNRVSIHERPAEVKRALPFGYWEGDLMIFSRSGGNALVLTEQKSRFILAAKQTGKKSLPTAAAIRRLFKSMPKQALASITFDNGGEFAAHESLRLDAYFCDPHSPWQKGAVENHRTATSSSSSQNQAGRRFRSRLRQDHCYTPRKCLGIQTPGEAFRHKIKSRRCA
jgi:IS30 family transposase